MADEGNETCGTEDRESDFMKQLRDPGITHERFKQLFKTQVEEIIKNDPLLKDLTPDVTLEELEEYVALYQGRAISLNLVRYDGVVIRKFKLKSK